MCAAPSVLLVGILGSFTLALSVEHVALLQKGKFVRRGEKAPRCASLRFPSSGVHCVGRTSIDDNDQTERS